MDCSVIQTPDGELALDSSAWRYGGSLLEILVVVVIIRDKFLLVLHRV